MPLNRPIEMTVLADEATPAHRVKVRAMDVSRSGLGVVTRATLRPGMRAVLPMTRSDGRRALLGVEVMHAHIVGDGANALGCAAGLRFFKLPRRL
ncbi:MAG: hypothetical protein KDA20_08760 [Phycisphaerales bacterium]|nr:hypothetical protein [Phycisphaerales bacterium]